MGYMVPLMRRRRCIAASTHLTGITLLVSLVLSTAVGPTALASVGTGPPMPPGIPSCATLSRTSLASLAGTGPLTVLKLIGPLCTFTGRIAGHYRPTLEVEIVPYSKPLWAAATGVHPADATVGHANAKLFFWTATVTSESAGDTSPCTAEDVITRENGPACPGQPTQDAFGATGYGPYKSGAPQLIVTVGLTGELGDVHLSHALALVTQILSGKIH